MMAMGPIKRLIRMPHWIPQPAIWITFFPPRNLPQTLRMTEFAGRFRSGKSWLY